jgi:hypothetical protein
MLDQLVLYARLSESSPDQTNLGKLTHEPMYRPQCPEKGEIGQPIVDETTPSRDELSKRYSLFELTDAIHKRLWCIFLSAHAFLKERE